MTLQEFRCTNCHRLLAKVNLNSQSMVEIKCRCGQMNTKGETFTGEHDMGARFLSQDSGGHDMGASLLTNRER